MKMKKDSEELMLDSSQGLTEVPGGDRIYGQEPPNLFWSISPTHTAKADQSINMDDKDEFAKKIDMIEEFSDLNTPDIAGFADNPENPFAGNPENPFDFSLGFESSCSPSEQLLPANNNFISKMINTEKTTDILEEYSANSPEFLNTNVKNQDGFNSDCLEKMNNLQEILGTNIYDKSINSHFQETKLLIEGKIKNVTFPFDERNTAFDFHCGDKQEAIASISSSILNSSTPEVANLLQDSCLSKPQKTEELIDSFFNFDDVNTEALNSNNNNNNNNDIYNNNKNDLNTEVLNNNYNNINIYNDNEKNNFNNIETPVKEDKKIFTIISSMGSKPRKFKSVEIQNNNLVSDGKIIISYPGKKTTVINKGLLKKFANNKTLTKDTIDKNTLVQNIVISTPSTSTQQLFSDHTIEPLSVTRAKRKIKTPLKYEENSVLTSDEEEEEEELNCPPKKKGRDSLKGLSAAEKYHRIRWQNNLASKKCREKKKNERLEKERELQRLQQINKRLKQKEARLKEKYTRIESLLGLWRYRLISL